MLRTVCGIELDIEPRGRIVDLICREVAGYADGLDLQPGDIVLDVGAHVGVVSCWLAKRFPGVIIYAFEPVPSNYTALLRNVVTNHVEDTVRVRNLAITGDGRDVGLYGNLEYNSGGSTIHGEGVPDWKIRSITLRSFMDDAEINRVALLKIDTEGAEYEILQAVDLRKFSAIRGETHIVPGQDETALLARILADVPNAKLTTGEPLSKAR